MPIETEAKFKVESHEPVRTQLCALGATRVGFVTETNRIFDRPDNLLQDQGCGLRVRSKTHVDGSSGPSTLTYKGSVSDGPLKSREEWEVSTSDADALTEILGRLGFAPILTYDKRRETWRFDDCLIELDEPPYVGLFVEIEGPTADLIRRVQSKLGLANATHVPSSYVHLLFQYCERHKLESRVLGFADEQ
jgi:adenylate cyclase class 2